MEGQDMECSAEAVVGPRHDPTGVGCIRPEGHDGWHLSENPFGGGGYYEWIRKGSGRSQGHYVEQPGDMPIRRAAAKRAARTFGR